MNSPVVILTLPPPPPLNGLYPTAGRRRVKSKRYKSWERTAGWELKRQRCGCIGGPWEADIALPSGLTGDIDGYIKPVLDLLVEHRVVDDDQFCRRLSIAKAITVGPDVIITIAVATP